jgi:uncharacterized protein YdhG (YjbR/CyaY superfamily)
MVISAAATVDQYLAELPPDRRAEVARVREVIRRNLPRGYEEAMGWGMISYTLPLALYPDTYNGQPLCYAGLAAQKNFLTLYLMAAYADRVVEKAIRDGFDKAGRKLDMGKSCIRFRQASDLPLGVIGKAVAAIPPAAFIAQYEAARRVNRPRTAAAGGRRPPSGPAPPPSPRRPSAGRPRSRARKRSRAAGADPRSGR